jgi:hypothetical protein
MKLTNEIIQTAIGNIFDQTDMIEPTLLNNDQIYVYEKLLSMYYEGLSSDIGWLSLIEANMVQIGIPKNMAFRLAVIKESEYLKSFFN